MILRRHPCQCRADKGATRVIQTYFNTFSRRPCRATRGAMCSAQGVKGPGSSLREICFGSRRRRRSPPGGGREGGGQGGSDGGRPRAFPPYAAFAVPDAFHWEENGFLQHVAWEGDLLLNMFCQSLHGYHLRVHKWLTLVLTWQQEWSPCVARRQMPGRPVYSQAGVSAIMI